MSKKRRKKYKKGIILLAAQEMLSMSSNAASNKHDYGTTPKVLVQFHGLGHAFVSRGRLQGQRRLSSESCQRGFRIPMEALAFEGTK